MLDKAILKTMKKYSIKEQEGTYFDLLDAVDRYKQYDAELNEMIKARLDKDNPARINITNKLEEMKRMIKDFYNMFMDKFPEI